MDHPLVKDVEYHLRRITVLIRHHTREHIAPYELTLPQYYALLFLREQTLTMGELCCRLYLASSTLTDLIDRMEKQGLVQRVRDEEDRRVIRLQIQEEGMKIIDQVMQDRLQFLSHKLDRLDATQVDNLAKALGDLHKVMEEEKV